MTTNVTFSVRFVPEEGRPTHERVFDTEEEAQAYAAKLIDDEAISVSIDKVITTRRRVRITG